MIIKKLDISVLVVDDDKAILELIEEGISDHVEHYYFAHNGSEALERFKASPIDMIISDVHMPIMDGIELLKHVRNKDKDIPFILLTGSKNHDVLVEAIQYNISSFLLKPIVLDDILAKIEEVYEAKSLKANYAVQEALFEQYKNAVDISSIVSKTDRKGIITYVNDRFCEISGYSREELVGQPHNIVRNENMPSSLFKQLWETIQSKNVWRGVLHNRAKDGSRYIVKTTVSPILDTNGNVYEYIAIREDITELENAKIEAEASARIKSEFISNMSHEIRTPLNAIMGFVSLLKNTSLSEQQERYIDIVSKATNNLLSVVNDILDFSKIEKDTLVLEPVKTDLRKEVSMIEPLYRIAADEKKIKFLINIDPAIDHCLFIDMIHLKQVLVNLIGNAIKFTDSGYVLLDISLVESIDVSQRLRFAVKDSGIGIASEKHKVIFDPFNQADNSSTRKYDGTGLGLTISSKLVKLMGSSLCLESIHGEGSEFYFVVDFQVCHDKTIDKVG